MGENEKLFERFGRLYPAGTVVFREGDSGQEMFVIQTGKVKIAKNIRGTEKVLDTLEPGEFFGEMALINQKPRSATATVVAEAKLLVLDPGTFDAMIRGNVEIAIRLIRTMAQRLQHAHGHIENLMLSDPLSRVVHFLFSLATDAPKTAEGHLVELDRAEIASRVALAAAQVEEALAKLIKGQLIQATPTGILVPDPGKLEEHLTFLEMKGKLRDGPAHRNKGSG